MLRRCVSMLAKIAEGVVTGVSCRPIYLRASDTTRYMHEYVLDHGQSYTLQWCKEDLCEFREGDRVKLHYDVKTNAGFEDHIIIRNSIKLLQRGNSESTHTHAQGDVAATSSRCDSHNDSSVALATEQALRCQLLEVVKALQLAKVKTDTATPVPMETLLAELIQGTRVLQTYVMTGEAAAAPQPQLQSQPQPQPQAAAEVVESAVPEGSAAQEPLQGSAVVVLQPPASVAQ